LINLISLLDPEPDSLEFWNLEAKEKALCQVYECFSGEREMEVEANC
jgi:hypothetical protein